MGEIGDALKRGALFLGKGITRPTLGRGRIHCADPRGNHTLALRLAAERPSLQPQVDWVGLFCFGMWPALRCGVKAHRDIEPENLMIDGSGILKVTDFGLVKLCETDGSLSDELRQGSSDRGLTQRGSVCGTPTLMSPEQFFDAQAVDCRADIYSFGVVLHLIISGGRAPDYSGASDLAEPSPVTCW